MSYGKLNILSKMEARYGKYFTAPMNGIYDEITVIVIS
jgi:hypothetical protein